MPIDSGNLALKGLDDLFSTEEKRQEEQWEQVQQIPIDALHPFTNHPFKVLDDEAMTRTVESIAQYGVLAPLIARPRPDGDGYEIISGHRRQYAAKLAGLDTLPVIVRNMDDDAAVLLMVDSNLQRENILPSERAFAYKMKLEALKNQGARSDLTSAQIGPKLTAAEKVAEEANDTKSQVKRFIRLTCLIPELLDMVDEKKIAFNPAVELSYLDEAQQRDFLEAMQSVTNWKVFGRKPCIWQVLPITKSYPNNLDAADVRHFLFVGGDGTGSNTVDCAAQKQRHDRCGLPEKSHGLYRKPGQDRAGTVYQQLCLQHPDGR